MGWNTTLTVVKECTPEDLGKVLTFGEPTSCDHGADDAVAIAVSGAVVIAGSHDRLAEIGSALAATERRTVTVVLGSVSDTYELRVQDGDAVLRHLVESAGDTVVDEGEPLAREPLAAQEQFAEDRFLALWQIAGGLMIGDWYFDPDGRAVSLAGQLPATPDRADTNRGLRRWFGRA
ncbi:hypothetical protein [Calidifontibacter terrae]